MTFNNFKVEKYRTISRLIKIIKINFKSLWFKNSKKKWHKAYKPEIFYHNKKTPAKNKFRKFLKTKIRIQDLKNKSYIMKIYKLKSLLINQKQKNLI